jgi:hypothetical protein
MMTTKRHINNPNRQWCQPFYISGRLGYGIDELS